MTNVKTSYTIKILQEEFDEDRISALQTLRLLSAAMEEEGRLVC